MSVHVRIVDHSKQFLLGFERLIDVRLDRAAAHLRDCLERNVSQPGPAPSPAGDFPHRQEGELAESYYWHRTPTGARAIGSTAPHALPLEKKAPDAGGRVHMERTLREEWKKILRIMEGR